MKKTLIITLEFPPTIGGIATYVHDLASALPQDSVVVLAPVGVSAADWDKKQSYKVIRKKMLWPKFIWPRWSKLFFQALGVVRREKIDLIMIHHVLPVGYVGLLLKWFTKIPYILFFHGTDVSFALTKAWKRRMCGIVAGEAKKLVFDSRSLQNRFLSIFSDLSDSSTIIYSSPEKIFFERPSEDVLNPFREQYALFGKYVMLSVSRLADGKGFPHLLHLLPQLLQKVPNLVWLVVGEGPKLDSLVGLVQKNNLQNSVRFVGAVSHEKLPLFYGVADVFALLTHPDQGKEEGLGLVFLEAAAMGVPAVAGRSGGVEEAVIDGQTGLLVDTNQDKQVIDAFMKIFTDRDYAVQLGRQARERMVTEFLWEKQVGNLST